MTAVIDQKLRAKENRRDHIQRALTTHPVIVTLKTNMPGNQANTQQTTYVLNRLNTQLETLFQTQGTYHEAADGDYNLYHLNMDALSVKKLCVYIEEHHPLGRLIDLDVSTTTKQLTRHDLTLPERPCFLCENPAAFCRRNQTHTLKALSDYFNQTIKQDIINALSDQAIHALRKEIYTYPCFGLVSSKTTGSHHDMNISHFLASLPVLKDAFNTYITLGIENQATPERLKTLGQNTEHALLSACEGINTYKGAHYIFGHVLPQLAWGLYHNQTLQTVIKRVKKVGRKFMTAGFKHPPMTTGEKAYQTLGIEGIRGEVAQGFPSIFSWYPESTLSPLKKLIKIMARLDDTTLLKRDDTLLSTVKDAMMRLESNNFKDLDTVHNQFKHISPGGAADLLALVFLFDATTPLLTIH